METEKETKTRECLLCRDMHEVVKLHGNEIIACPLMPENTMMPESTLKAFLPRDKSEP